MSKNIFEQRVGDRAYADLPYFTGTSDTMLGKETTLYEDEKVNDDSGTILRTHYMQRGQCPKVIHRNDGPAMYRFTPGDAELGQSGEYYLYGINIENAISLGLETLVEKFCSFVPTEVLGNPRFLRLAVQSSQMSVVRVLLDHYDYAPAPFFDQIGIAVFKKDLPMTILLLETWGQPLIPDNEPVWNLLRSIAMMGINPVTRFVLTLAELPDDMLLAAAHGKDFEMFRYLIETRLMEPDERVLLNVIEKGDDASLIQYLCENGTGPSEDVFIQALFYARHKILKYFQREYPIIVDENIMLEAVNSEDAAIVVMFMKENGPITMEVLKALSENGMITVLEILCAHIGDLSDDSIAQLRAIAVSNNRFETAEFFDKF